MEPDVLQEVRRIAKTPVCIPRPPVLVKHPQPTTEDKHREVALREALLSGAMPLRDPRKMAMLKPKPMLFTPDLSHLQNCTSCINQAAAVAAARHHALLKTPGAPQLLVDDAPLATWADVVLELEVPRKTRVKFQQAKRHSARHRGRAGNARPHAPQGLLRAHPVPRQGFGMPGTVLLDDNGKFRAWLGQSVQRYAESADGLIFDEPGAVDRGLKWTPPTLPPRIQRLRGEAQRRRAQEYYLHFGELGYEMFNTKERALEQETFTVFKDAQSPHPAHRFKAAFTCDLLGHAPYPRFWRYKQQEIPPREMWLSAPIFNGERVYTWESTCLALSPDGLNWTFLDLGHQQGKGPEPLRSASDTANVIYRDLMHIGFHHVINRWAAPIPQGAHGTPRVNPNWWREVRGVRVSTTADLDTASEPAAARSSNGERAPEVEKIRFTEASRWILDREGKAEHLRRQVYSLQVTPLPASNVYVGLLNVLEWPKLMNPTEQPPFQFDTMRTYLATSRDGVHFDTDWVYSGRELIPNGKCHQPPYCLSLQEVEDSPTGISSGAVALDELCCPFDHGITVPASSVLTVNGEHRIYYEGRVGYHEARYSSKYPMAVGVAVWRQHRLAGVRSQSFVSGSQRTGNEALSDQQRSGQHKQQRCGVLVTKPIDLSELADGRRSRVFHFRVDVGIGAEGMVGSLRDGDTASSSALFAEVVLPCHGNRSSASERATSAQPRFLRTHSLARSIPITSDVTNATLRWVPHLRRQGSESNARATVTTLSTAQPAVSLRFVLCGSAKLFAFSAWNGDPSSGERELGSWDQAYADGMHTMSSDANHKVASLPTTEPTIIQGGRSSHRLYTWAAAQEASFRARWDVRRDEMSRHAIAYGRCEAEEPVRILIQEETLHSYTAWRRYPACPTMHAHGPGCSYSLGTPPDISKGGSSLNGVQGCRDLCETACPECGFASLSWSRYECVCYSDKCDVKNLALSQVIDDTHPDMMHLAANGERRRIVNARGGGSDPLFDWVTFALHDDPRPEPERNATSRVPRFPRKLWQTTAEWANDWALYVESLDAHGLDPYCVPSWTCGGREQAARQHARERLRRRVALGENSTSGQLDGRARKVLGVLNGFCAITTDAGSCDHGEKGTIQLSQLLAHVDQPHHWKKALKACRRFCSDCANCNYVTLSISQNDCSWYRSCDLNNLNTRYAGFYSTSVAKKNMTTA